MAERVPDYLLERLVADDLSHERADPIRERLRGEPNGDARIEGVKASNAQILAEHPPTLTTNAIRRRTSRSTRTTVSRGPWLMMFALPTTAAALALGLWIRNPTATVMPSSSPQMSSSDFDGDRIKGLPSLHVYRRSGARVERLTEGVVARAGDQLQLAYLAAGYRFGAVFSVDGAGNLTFHLSDGSGHSTRLQAGAEVTLPESYQLDAAPGYERFWFVVSNVPFSTQALVDAAGSTASPPPGCAMFSFTVRKDSRGAESL